MDGDGDDEARDAEGDGEPDPEGAGDGEPVGDGETEPDGDAEGESEGDGESEGEDDAAGVGDDAGDGMGEGVGVVSARATKDSGPTRRLVAIVPASNSLITRSHEDAREELDSGRSRVRPTSGARPLQH